MADIHIVYPPDSTSNGFSTLPVVLRNEASVMAGEAIVWHIWSVNSLVKLVTIEFKSAAHNFFNGQYTSGYFALTGTAYDSGNIKSPDLNEVVIVGIAPKFLGKGTSCDYSVRAMKNLVGDLNDLDLDPKIIIDGP